MITGYNNNKGYFRRLSMLYFLTYIFCKNLPILRYDNIFYKWGALFLLNYLSLMAMGPAQYTGEIIIAVGFPEDDLRKSYREVEPVESLTNPYMMPYEKENRIYLCRNPIKKFQELNSWFKWLN